MRTQAVRVVVFLVTQVLNQDTGFQPGPSVARRVAGVKEIESRPCPRITRMLNALILGLCKPCPRCGRFFRRCGSFMRHFRLHATVMQDKIRADYKNGILVVRRSRLVRRPDISSNA